MTYCPFLPAIDHFFWTYTLCPPLPLCAHLQEPSPLYPLTPDYHAHWQEWYEPKYQAIIVSRCMPLVAKVGL